MEFFFFLHKMYNRSLYVIEVGTSMKSLHGGDDI